MNSPQLASLTRSSLCGRLLPILLRRASQSSPTDVLELSYSLSLDLVNGFLFGYSSGSNFLQNEGSTRHWLEQYEHRYTEASFWPQELPRLTRLLGMMGVEMLPREQPAATAYLEQWMMKLCDDADTVCSLAEKGPLQDAGDDPVVYRQIKKAVLSDLQGADPLTQRREVASELFDHMC